MCWVKLGKRVFKVYKELPIMILINLSMKSNGTCETDMINTFCLRFVSLQCNHEMLVITCIFSQSNYFKCLINYNQHDNTSGKLVL